MSTPPPAATPAPVSSARPQRPVISGPWRRGAAITFSAIILFAALAVVALFSQALSFTFVLFGLGGMLLVGWLWINANLRGLVIRRRMDDHAFFGQTVPVRLELHNRGLWPLLWVRLHERLPIELAAPNFFRAIASLGPREKAHYSYNIVGLKRGYYTIGVLQLHTGDMWGFFENAASFPAQPITIYPRVVRFTRLGIHSHAPFGELPGPQRLNEDPSRFYGVRPYTSGDSMRKIDWKSTAATGALQVRRFQSSIALDSFVLLDLSQDAYPIGKLFTATEFAITLAASLAVYLTEKRQQFGLAVLGKDPRNPNTRQHTLPLRKGQAHLQQALELLAGIQFGKDTPDFMTTLQQQAARLPWGAVLFIIRPGIDAAFLDQMLGLRRRGLQPVVLLTVQEHGFADLRARGQQLGVPCLRIRNDKDLAIWRA